MDFLLYFKFSKVIPVYLNIGDGGRSWKASILLHPCALSRKDVGQKARAGRPGGSSFWAHVCAQGRVSVREIRCGGCGY